MNAVAVSLREWETLQPDSSSPLAGRNLNDSSRTLAERLSSGGYMEVLELARGVELRATSFVGRFRLGEVTVTVQPKLPGAPFLNLLRYAYGLRHLELFDPVAYESEKWTFQDLLIRQLAAEAAELLARGIHREYERLEADLASPKGRIEFRRLAAMQYRSRAALPCIHHPRTEDTVINQVLLAGLAHAASLATNIDLRTYLTRLAKTLSASVSLKKLTSTLLDDGRQTIDRRTTSYRSALVLIEILFEGEGVSFDGATSRLRLPGFLFDMNRFFQALMSRFLHDNLEGCEVQDERRLIGLFCYDSNRNPQNRRAPIQKPDFVVRSNHEIAAILDAKYRDLWEKPLPREMLYQLALYALGRRVGERKAVILYSTLAGGACEQVIQLREPFSGAFQAQVILRPVNLLELEKLLRARDPEASKRKAALAHELSFGNILD